jgi:hypothetical protein
MPASRNFEADVIAMEATFRFSLNQDCSEGFLRTYALPASERDYVLSKLYQFFFLSLSQCYEVHDLDPSLYRMICRVPYEQIRANVDRWADIWFDSFISVEEQTLDETLDALFADVVSIKRSTGFEADHERHWAIAEIAIAYGRGWRRNIADICAELDSKGVAPPKNQETRKPYASWKAMLRAGRDRATAAIYNSMKMNSRRTG